jgi:FAD/FMN-containing dehydrogenase
MTAPFDFSKRADLTDDGGRPLNAILIGTDDVAAAVRQAVQQGYAVMPAGGLTSAINSFDYPAESLAGFQDVVAIRPKGALTPEVVPATTPLQQIRSHQLAIDAEHGCVMVGAGLTYAQVNMVLAHMLGDTARVLVDLTSSASASVGGVVATGGMGPLRTHPSSYLLAACLADGSADAPRVVTGEELFAHEGMQGWTGMITAVRMRWFEVPPQEFGLVLPVQGSDVDAVADLLSYLHPWTQVAVPPDGNVLMAADGGSTIVNGIELISRSSLAQFVEHAADPARSKAEGLLQACDYANADMLACITGWSEMPVDEVLFSLMDEATETIGGVGIEYGIGFSSGSEMEIFRAIREGAPDLARTQARVVPPGKLRPWTTSTDVNVRVPKDTAAIGAVLRAYADYRAAVAELAERLDGRAEVILSAYGHLSPQGIDPHHRVTVIADQGQEAALDEARQTVAALKKQLIRDLAAAVNEFGGTMTGGEKGMPSVLDIARAVGDNALPDNLKARIERARGTLAAAPKAFSFRAPAL